MLDSARIGRVNGRQNVTSGGLVYLESATASSETTLDLFGAIDDTYLFYMFRYSITVGTDNDALVLQTTADNSTVDSGASDYSYSRQDQYSATASDNGSAATDRAFLSSSTAGRGIGSAAGEAYTGFFWLFDPLCTLGNARAFFEGSYVDSSGNVHIVDGSFCRTGQNAIKGVELATNNGNAFSGSIEAYGLV